MSNIQSKLVNLGGNITGTLPIANGGTANVTASAAFNALSPITTTGDIIYSSSGTTNSRLAIGASGTVLHGGTTPTYSQIVDADVSASAAIAGSKLVAATASVAGAITTSNQALAGRKTAGNSKVWAYLGSNQTGLAASNRTRIAFDTESFDTNNEFDSTSTKGRFTATQAGYYWVYAQLFIAGSLTVVANTQIEIDKNGSRSIYPNFVGTNAAGNPFGQVGGLFSLNGSTDYIEIFVFNGEVGTISIGANSGDPGYSFVNIFQLL